MFDEFLGLSVVEASARRVVARAPVGRQLLQPYGIVHGGVYSAMADSVAATGAREARLVPDSVVIGQSNQTDLLRATREGELVATATPVHVGRTVQLWSVDVVNELPDGTSRLAAQARVRLACRPTPTPGARAGAS